MTRAASNNCIRRVVTHIRERPEGLAMWTATEGITSMGDMGRLIASAQALLREAGVEPGDAVLLLALPGPRLYAAFLAVLGLGATCMLVEPWLGVGAIDHVVRRTSPKVFVASTLGKVWGMRVPSIRAIPKWLSIDPTTPHAGSEPHVADVSLDTPAMITFTSGTTGTSKGIVRSHGFMEDAHVVLTRGGTWDRFPGPDLAVFPGIAMFHLATGRGALLVPPRWRQSALERMAALPEALQPHTVSCGPAFLSKLLGVRGFSSLRTMYIGGAQTDCSLVERAAKRWPDTKLWHVYGGTEAEPVALVDARDAVRRSRARGLHQLLYLGGPIEEIRARPTPEGMWVAGPHVCPEYVGAVDENRAAKKRDADGTLWHFMGDRIDVDDEGWWYAGRASQPAGDFALEQRIYAFLGSSASFIDRARDGDRTLVGENVAARESDVRARFPEIAGVREARIRRDRRHRARIDRAATSRTPTMTRWLTYVRERSPIAMLLVIGLGPAFSARALGHHSLEARGVLWVLAGLLPFFVLARLMDERKDFEKDKVAHPDRPLPRGLLTVTEVERVIGGLTLSSLVLAGVFAVVAGPVAGALYAGAMVWLWLMYKEFYLSDRLAAHPVVYALVHQIVILPLYGFAIAVGSPEAAFSRTAIGYVLANLGSSMAFEVARKLDPEAPAVLKTYLSIFGRGKTALLVLASLAGAGAGAYLLGLGKLLWPVEGYAALHLGLLWARPKAFKIVEGATGLASLAHLWSVYVAHLVGWW